MIYTYEPNLLTVEKQRCPHLDPETPSCQDEPQPAFRTIRLFLDDLSTIQAESKQKKRKKNHLIMSPFFIIWGPSKYVS